MQRNRSAALINRVARTIARHGMAAAGERILVALSGGPDSVALLAALHGLAERLQVHLTAAHFNHGWRGAESDRDQACAEGVATRLGIACVVGSAAAPLARRNREASARAERYAFFERVAAAQGCTRIATGHTADDQAETVLLHLLRGAGWDGLAAIPPVRDATVIRPLIACERPDILAFLDEQGLPFCHDSSNTDRRFLRNRVRYDVLPHLQALNPRATHHLAAAATVAAAERVALDDWAAAMLGPEAELTVAALHAVAAGLRGRLVRVWLRRHRGSLNRLSAAHVHAVVDLALGARPNVEVALPGGRVVRAYDALAWTVDPLPAVPDVDHEIVPGQVVELAGGWRIVAAVDSAVDTPVAPPVDLWTCTADADLVSLPLCVRSGRAGDRIQPLGMTGHRKLQDVFVDRKVPRTVRRSCPVVTVADAVLWVPGVVRSAHALIGPGTRSVLRLSAQKPGVAGGKWLC